MSFIELFSSDFVEMLLFTLMSKNKVYKIGSLKYVKKMYFSIISIIIYLASKLHTHFS